jgi:hypothetical protein
MGTSQSSKGPPGNVPMVPPWVPNAPPPSPDMPPPGGPEPGMPNQDGSQNPSQPVPTTPTAAPPSPIAPNRRFAGARRSLGSFAQTGNTAAMRKGVGHYVRSGYGGAPTAARRFGGTANTASALYSALSPSAAGVAEPAAGERLDRALLAGRSAEDIMDSVVEAVRPVDGTQDAEVSRAAIKDSLSELLTKFPDANLLELTDEERTFAIERFVALDVFRRFAIDLGKTIQDKVPSAALGLARLKEVKEYVKETVSAAFRRLVQSGRSVTSGKISEIVQSALLDALQVFEHYAQ